MLVAVERLRRVLDAHRPGAAESLSRTVAGGYLLAVESDALDADVFRARVKEGRAAVSPASSEPARAVALLRAALGLWRGRALADVA